MTGEWVHAEDPSFRYLAEDDGGTVRLTVTRLAPVDAGFRPRRFRPEPPPQPPPPPPTRRGSGRDAGRPAEADAGVPADAGAEEDAGVPAPILVFLQRTPGGFVGATETTLRHPAGHTCDVRFETRVLACADGGLLLETDSAAAVGDACQPPARPQGVAREQHHLLRLPTR
jgi:hypothetical protein